VRALINQKVGLGDILFSIPIAFELLKDYKEVIWPVSPPYLWLRDYFPNISFVSSEDYDWLHDFGDELYRSSPQQHELNSIPHPEHLEDDLKIINLRYANVDHRSETCMVDKYKLLGLDVSLWKSLFWKRDIKKEAELYKKLNPSDVPYNLINRNSEYPPKKGTITVDNDMLNVDMEIIEGYTLLDWGLLIENAANIHTVSTALNYVVEAIGNKKQGWFVYPRSGDSNLQYVSFLSDNWSKIL
jgi:hypothetical protein